jgi:hypothetical protein
VALSLLRLLSLVSLATLALPAFAGATASDFKKETKKGANYWNAQAAIDGDMKTCWMVPGESQNKGEWIMLEAPKSKIDKIGMVVGWGKDDAIFKDYARVKTVNVIAYKYDDDNNMVEAARQVATFEDKPGMQVVDIEDMQIGDENFGGKVKIEVTDFYEGKDFPNLAVSEVLMVLTEFDAKPVVKSVSSEDAGHDGGMMIDLSPKTFWSGDAAGAALTFEASGFSLARVGITPGPKEYARPKKVKVTANERSVEAELPDKAGAQWVEIPAVVGYTGSAWGMIKVEILETYPGTKFPTKVAINELDAKATAMDGI